METTYYKIRYADYDFYAIIEKKNNRITRIYVGGKKKGYAIVEIDNNDATFHISYGKECNIQSDLTRGIETISLAKATLAFAFQKMPLLKNIYLKETSRMTVKNIVGN